MKRFALAALAFLPALTSAAPPDKADPALRAALLQTDTDWARVTSQGKDVEKILSYWSDDAIVYPPRMASVSGKAAIRNYVTQSLKLPFFSINWKPAQAIVAESGDLGYTMGSNEVTVADPTGKVERVPGRYLTVWRRTGGVWKCVVDFWNESPLAVPPIVKPSPSPTLKPTTPPKPTTPAPARPAAQPTPKPAVKPTIKPQ